ncbi:MAG: asparagine synthase (glutamine-hydrolyzing) [Alphaproteobacteria bacterium]|nr:asparagine synthase (glutamine-hydrolyzing) [Alphaproteobacteria bacterium]
MCGIAGAFSRGGGKVDRPELVAVRDAMRQRGPDGEGLWLGEDGAVGLGHRRLAIIDLSPAGAQPMARGSHVITFNGEIYNYRALRAELEAKGHAFKSHSDTEVLLVLYAEHGPAMLSRLRGMYAFALWDGDKKQIFLARDPFGIKPLYWSDDGRIFRFASQVKALLKADVDKSSEPAGHVGFLLWGSVPEPWTLYRGIRALPSGHWMIVDRNGPREPVSFASVTDTLAAASANPSRLGRGESLASLSAAIRDSVKAHLEADVPVGVFLSAGMDSTLLASGVAATGSRPLTVTLGFDEYAGTADDEAPLAETVAGAIKADHVTKRLRRDDFESVREQILAAMDQPSVDGVNTWLVARAAASRGLKVALSGLGGDEMFASYSTFREVPRVAGFFRYPAMIPGLGKSFRLLTAALAARLTSPKYAGLLEYGGSLGGVYLLRRGLYAPWELPRILDPDMVRDGWAKLETRARLKLTLTGIAGARLPVSALEMCWYMRNQLLRDSDWAGMAHSLEIRVPLVDWPLLAAAAPVFAAHPDIVKSEVVRAAAPDLPDPVFSRPKSGFSVPVQDWIKDPALAAERGMRGWARQVYRRFSGA